MAGIRNRMGVILRAVVWLIIFLPSLSSAQYADVPSLLKEGRAMMAEGRYEEALNAFDQGLQYEPDNLSLLVSRGQALMKMKLYPEAEKQFLQILDMGGEAAKAAYVELGAFYALTKQYLTALKYFTLASEASPERADLYLARGSMYMELEDYYSAEICFNRAVEIDCKLQPTALYYKALLAYRQEDFESTRNLADQALALNPDAGLRKSISQLKKTADEEEHSLKPWHIALYAIGQYDSNVPLEPEDGFESFGGAPTDTEDWCSILQATGTGYFWNSRHYKTGIDYTIRSQNYLWLNEFDQLVNDAGLFFAYHKNPWYFNVRTDFGYYMAQRETHHYLWAITPTLTRVWTPKDRTQLLGYYAYKSTVVDTDNVNRYVFDAIHFHTFKPPKKKDAVGVIARGGFRLEREVPTGEIAWNYIVYELKAGISFPVPLEFEGDLGLGYALADYKENRYLSPGRSRHDNRLSLAAKLGRKLSENFRTDFIYNYTNNDSNLENAAGNDLYQYQRNVFSLMFTGNF